MYRKSSSALKLIKHQSFIQSTTQTAILNTSRKILNNERQSKMQRWIFGMIIGSSPFLAIIICWMLVTVCINNFGKFYRHRKKRYRNDARANGLGSIVSKMSV